MFSGALLKLKTQGGLSEPCCAWPEPLPGELTGGKFCRRRGPFLSLPRVSAVARRCEKAGSEVQNQVAVEVPELQPFLLWRAYCLIVDGSLPVMVSNREDFRRSRGDDATRDSVRHLLDHGRPAPPYVRIFY